MDILVQQLIERGFTPEEATSLGYKISAVKELEHWGRQEPTGLDEDELRGYRAARDRVTQIASETDDPQEAADALREIVNNLPSLQNGRDRGRARALNEALDALEKNDPEAVDGANMNLPPAGSHQNMPTERTPMDSNNAPKSGPGMGTMPDAPGGGFGGMGTTVGKLAQNPIPTVPGRYNPDTGQREPWLFDDFIEGEPNKFFVTWEGNLYAWVIDENLEPKHMKIMKLIKGKYIGETPAFAGRYLGDYPIIENVASPEDLEEGDYELLVQVFPEGFYVGNGFVDPLDKVAKFSGYDVNYLSDDDGFRWYLDHGYSGGEYEDYSVLYCLDGDDRVGMVHFDVEGDLAEIILVKVEPDYRGLGLSDLLYQKIIELFQEEYPEVENIIGEITSQQILKIRNRNLGEPAYIGEGHENLPELSPMLTGKNDLTEEQKVLVRHNFKRGAANIPPTSRRAFFDLKKFVDLEGENIDWDEFKSSSSVNDRELDSVLEILTEIGAATDMDGQPGRGSFRIDKRELDSLLANKESR